MAKNPMVPPLSANPMGGGNGGVMLNPNNPSATNPSSLRNLMQRIQLAVYAGYLNPQVGLLFDNVFFGNLTNCSLSLHSLDSQSATFQSESRDSL